LNLDLDERADHFPMAVRGNSSLALKLTGQGYFNYESIDKRL
jgi:hypothetical protein